MVHLSHTYMTSGKTIALTVWTFVSNMISLFFNMLSRFVIAFKEHASFNFLAAVGSVVGLEPKKIKSATVSTFSPSICLK